MDKHKKEGIDRRENRKVKASFNLVSNGKTESAALLIRCEEHILEKAETSRFLDPKEPSM